MMSIMYNKFFRKCIKSYLKDQEKEAKVKGDKYAKKVYHQYRKTFF